MGWELCSTQKFSLTAEYAEVCPKRFGATVQRAVGFAKLGGQSGVGDNWAGPNGMGPGAGCEAPTVQLGCAHNGGLVLRTQPKWRESVQMELGTWVQNLNAPTGWGRAHPPTSQLAQFGTKRAKRGAGGLGAFGPTLGAHNLPCLRWVDYFPFSGGSITS